MYNWNLAYVQYCDGGSFSGNRTDALVATVNGTTRDLWFRGGENRLATIQDLASPSLAFFTSLRQLLPWKVGPPIDNHKLADATEVMVTGCSAGAMAAYLHGDKVLDQIRAVAPNLKKAGISPDSGFFMDYEGNGTYSAHHA